MSNSAVPAVEAWKIVGNNSEFMLPNTTTEENVCKNTGDSQDILTSFSSTFGCREQNSSKWKSKRSNYLRKFRTAKKCLTRRITEMGKYNAITTKNREQRKRHIYPIKTAYTLGRNCLRKFTTRKNAVNKFTGSVNRKLVSLGKNDVWSNSEYGLNPSIASHITEKKLKKIYNKNYGFKDDAAWDHEFASRLETAALNDTAATNRNNSDTSNNGSTNGSTNGRNTFIPRGGITGGGSAITTIPTTEPNSEKLLNKAAREETEKHEKILQTGISSALFYKKHIQSFYALFLYFFELRTIKMESLVEKEKEKLNELQIDNRILREFFTSFIDRQHDFLFRLSEEYPDATCKLENVYPSLIKFQKEVETHDQAIQSFLSENGICKTDAERTYRQDAIINDVNSQVLKSAVIISKTSNSLKDLKPVTKTQRDIKKEMETNLKNIKENFEYYLRGYELINTFLERSPQKTPDYKLDSFWEFRAFLSRHLELVRKFQEAK